jgi:hypothetical protein
MGRAIATTFAIVLYGRINFLLNRWHDPDAGGG